MQTYNNKHLKGKAGIKLHCKMLYDRCFKTADLVQYIFVENVN
jgi:hypothetical protein